MIRTLPSIAKAMVEEPKKAGLKDGEPKEAQPNAKAKIDSHTTSIQIFETVSSFISNLPTL